MDPNIHHTQGTAWHTRDNTAQQEVEEDAEAREIGKVLGDRVGRLRTERKMSQRQLQLEAGLGHGYVSILEAGRVQNPGIQQLYKVATALGVPLIQLLTDDTSSSAGVKHTEQHTPFHADEVMPSPMDPQLEELQRGVEELWNIDKERFAALRLVVRDMQQKAAETAQAGRGRQK